MIKTRNTPTGSKQMDVNTKRETVYEIDAGGRTWHYTGKDGNRFSDGLP